MDKDCAGEAHASDPGGEVGEFPMQLSQAWEKNKRLRMQTCQTFQRCIMINKTGRGLPPHSVDAWLDSPLSTWEILGVIKASAIQLDGHMSPLLTLCPTSQPLSVCNVDTLEQPV